MKIHASTIRYLQEKLMANHANKKHPAVYYSSAFRLTAKQTGQQMLTRGKGK
jgi:hypothetical protein